MRVAYIVSTLTASMTFVVNEMEAHENADWQVFPLISCKKYGFENLSALMLKWNRKSFFRANYLVIFWYFLKLLVTIPIRATSVFCWISGLLFISLSEFLKAIYELLPAFYYSQICNDNCVEHLHVHFASRSLSLGIMISMLTAKPISCTAHAFDIFTRSVPSLKYRLKYCKFVSTVSLYNVNYLRKNCGDDIANRTYIVHCGVDTSKFSFNKSKPAAGRMVAIARLTPKKGFDYAIRACAELKKSGVDFKYDIIGGGKEYDRLYGLVKTNGLEENVVLHGPRSNDEVREYLKEASLFLMPCIILPNGDMDGIPVAMMEAMSCGVPILSTDISGIPELIKHDHNGWVVPEKDIGALVNMLKTVLHNYNQLKMAGENARKYIQKEFSMEKNAKKIRELINE